jgi:hypothetical protein
VTVDGFQLIRNSEAEENDLIWKTDSSSVEIRFQGRLEDGRTALDECVATGAAIHQGKVPQAGRAYLFESPGGGSPIPLPEFETLD